MRLTRILGAAVISALILVPHMTAQSAANPIQVALLRWYQANTAVAFYACSGGKAGSLAFDGRHIWVTCYGAVSEVEEFNASDRLGCGRL